MMKHTAHSNTTWLVMTACAALLAPTVSMAVPSSLNLIPTADVLPANEFTLQVEADGHRHPCDTGGEYWLLSGFCIGDRLEIGVDRSLPQDGGGEWFMDAKLQIVPESATSPAIAVGTLDLTRGGIESNWYLVATRDIGPLRTTAGYSRDDEQRLLLGASWDVSERLTLMSDYSSAPGGALTIGACSEVAPGTYALLYFAQGNTTDADNFVGLNVSWSLNWR